MSKTVVTRQVGYLIRPTRYALWYG